MQTAVKVEKIVLTGGCFQNKYLTEKAIAKLRTADFHPYWHHRTPPNDGSIALGQAITAILETTRILNFVNKVEQYVIVHVGFAISIVDESEAQKTLDYLEQIQV